MKRYILPAIFIFCIFFVTFYQGNTVLAEDKNESGSLAPVLIDDLLLYQGETRCLDIKRVGGKSSVGLESSNPSVVSVSDNGEIKALKCGTSFLTVLMERGSVSFKAVIRIRVVYSSFYHTKEYAGQIKEDKNNKKMPLLSIHSTLKINQTEQIRLDNIATSAVITYLSSSEDVVSVNNDGLITAKQQGRAVIKIKVEQNQNSYIYRKVIHVKNEEERAAITEDIRNAYFGKSGFIGSSIGVGQNIYFTSKGSGFLGGPEMMVKGCYSFANEKSSSYEYKITYRGTPYKAKDAIAVSGVKRVFINMGTNDLWQSPEKTYEDYREYLKEIRAKNPDVVIFIESTTPVYRGSDRGYLSNAGVDKLNSLIKGYCNENKDMYYIDITSILRDESGCLRQSYCSDGFVHITIEGYRVWTDELCRYVDKLLISEIKADDAVKTVSQSRIKRDWNYAEKMVGRLKDSSVKDKLLERLGKVREKGLKRMPEYEV